MEVRLQEFEEQIQRMQAFMDFCGNPENTFPSIHVAGTSGKGSVVNLIYGLLSSAGLKVGYHVSPYLQVCNEKLIVDGKMIRPSDFSGLVHDFREKHVNWLEAQDQFGPLKYGEAWVALTFLWLAKQNVDWGVIETGLGGRYDPTNVVSSKLAVITNINYDHVEVLGESLEEIAYHKAGIIKPNGLAVTGETNPAPWAVIAKEAKDKNTTLFSLGKDFGYQIRETGDGVVLDVNGVYHDYKGIKVNMGGDYQYLNAAMAIASVDVLAKNYEVPINLERIKEGVGKTIFSGRFEAIQKNPLVILDGAHNLHKAGALAASLKQEYPGEKFIVVLGTLSIKDFSGIIKSLAPLTKTWIATQPHVFGKPSASPEALAEVIRSVAPDATVIMKESVGEGVDAALALAGETDKVVVTGSLYMVGEARNRWYPTYEILSNLELED